MGEKRESGEMPVVPSPVRNKEQKIDRLLSFMFLPGADGGEARPSPFTGLSVFPFFSSLSYLLAFFLFVIASDVLFFSLSLSLSSSAFCVTQ